MMKPLRHILRAIKAGQKGLALWWLKMSDQEQREILSRGGVIAVCATTACLLLPVIGVRFEEQRSEAAFRLQAMTLAEAESIDEATRNVPHSATLLEHNWVRSVGYTIEREPRAALSRYAMHARDDSAVTSVIPDLVRDLDTAELANAEYDCLTQAIYYEAGHEVPEGKLAVAEVIMNRVADHRYPNSVCDVVYQGATRTTGCQFTFTCDGALRRKPQPEEWAKARMAAAHVLMGLNDRSTGSATHYHATYVDPIWNVGLVRTNKIGAHIFYRFPRGSEWVKAREAVAEKKAYRARLASYESEGYDIVSGGLQGSGQLEEISVSPAP